MHECVYHRHIFESERMECRESRYQEILLTLFSASAPTRTRSVRTARRERRGPEEAHYVIGYRISIWPRQLPAHGVARVQGLQNAIPNATDASRGRPIPAAAQADAIADPIGARPGPARRSARAGQQSFGAPGGTCATYSLDSDHATQRFDSVSRGGT